MAGTEQALSGPDLAEGIALTELSEGEPLLGHKDGEAVVLVRVGDAVRAVGATCTHYGGPLAEGLVVGDTVRCPWHHACFSLRTGEAFSAPALSPLPVWEVEVRDGVVRLGARLEEPVLSARGRDAAGPDPVVILGAGAAGSAAAEALRREGYAGRVLLVDAEVEAPYDRPNLSKDYLAGSAPEEWIPLRPAGFYEESGVERVSERAVSIEREHRRIRLASGDTVDYGALLIATGATARALPVPGADAPHVHTLRSLSDCREIIALAERGGPAVVVGASFIGMEVAASLRSRGLDVTVVAPEDIPFRQTLGSDAGALLRGAHERAGVRFRLGRTVASITAGHVELDDGSQVPAGLVVVGIGVTPNTGVAESAGLDVDDGVVVDASLRSSDPRIWAAGDVARLPDPWSGGSMRVEHWVVAQRQGQAAARSILGGDEPYRDVPFFWTRQFDVGLSYVGHAPSWDRVEVDGDPQGGDGAFRYLDKGRLAALATVGRDRLSLETEVALAASARVGATPSAAR